MNTPNGTEAFPDFHVSKVLSGTLVYPPNSRFGPRVQADLQLVLLHTGRIDLYVDETLYPISPGHVVLLKPGHLEEFRFAKDHETWHRWITVITDDLPQETLKYLHKLPFFLPISYEMNQLADLTMSLRQTQRPEFNDTLRKLGLAAILLYVAECANYDVSRSMHPAVLIAKSSVKAHYAESLSLSDMALAASITPDHLIRLFRKEEGITPSQYLWHYRIERGIELLRNSGLTISEIAYRTGFKTSYHFARSIKRFTGFTPTEIRKENWNAE